MSSSETVKNEESADFGVQDMYLFLNFFYDSEELYARFDSKSYAK